MSDRDLPVPSDDVDLEVGSVESVSRDDLRNEPGGPHKLRAVTFSGPIPPPDLLRGYEEICPGLADRMFTFVEKQGQHQREIEKSIVAIQAAVSRSSFVEARMGQIFAFLIAISAMCVGAYTALNGREWAGGIIGVGGIGSIVTAFIAGRHREQKPSAQQKSSESAASGVGGSR